MDEAGSGGGRGLVIHYKQKDNRDSIFEKLTEALTCLFANPGSLSIRLKGRLGAQMLDVAVDGVSVNAETPPFAGWGFWCC